MATGMFAEGHEFGRDREFDPLGLAVGVMGVPVGDHRGRMVGQRRAFVENLAAQVDQLHV